MKKLDIKIYVSQRIDVPSTWPRESVYIPVKCGACYIADAQGAQEIQGDNTGENISEKRLTFNELTVQYWAWKNCRADYMGLCHYRRYLNLCNVKENEDSQCKINELLLDFNSIKKYSLDDIRAIESEVNGVDVITSKEYPVKVVSMPKGQVPKSVYEFWKMQENILIIPGALDQMIKLIKKYFPEIEKSATEYLNNDKFRGYNCFLMKRELYNNLCNFEFTILFELEKSLDLRYANEITRRTCGYLGEILYSIYIYYLKTNGYRVKERSLIFFEETRYRDEIKVTNECITIVTTANENTFNSVNILIESICKNCSEKVEIIILSSGLNDENKKLLGRLASEKTNILIHDLNYFTICNKGNYYHPNKRMPLFYFPWMTKSCKTALFISPESIVCQDLLNIVKKIDHSKVINAVKSYQQLRQTNDQYNNGKNEIAKIQRLRQGDPYRYFSSSLMIVNLEKFREKYDLFRINDVICNSKMFLTDDDIWNLIINDCDVGILDYYSNMKVFAGFEYRIFDNAPYDESKEWVKAQQNPITITSQIWRTPGTPYSHLFWSYARCTEIYEKCLSEYINSRIDETIKIRGCRNKCFIRKFAINVIDKIFPKGTYKRKLIIQLLPVELIRIIKKRLYN